MNLFKYPDLKHLAAADHLLFDIGYSSALLWRAKELLKEITECGDYPIAVDELLEQIADFETGRLQIRSEIYANAEEAARRG